MSWYSDDDFYEDNSILNDYRTPTNTIVLKGPLYAESRRGEIGREWWGQQWVQTMERLGLEGRLQRGKGYARNGSVLRIEISAGKVYAEVQGSRAKPYRTLIELRAFQDDEWARAFKALSAQAIYAAKLLAGEMPADIEALFEHHQLPLFPQRKRDIDFTCSCPDWGDPCKHVAAVYYLIAEQLDADPFILFHLRGRNREATMRALQGGSASADPSDNANALIENPPLDVATFWGGGSIGLVRQSPQIGKAPIALQQLGGLPQISEKPLLAIYQDISQEAQRWLGN